jgi:chaperonin GroEL
MYMKTETTKKTTEDLDGVVFGSVATDGMMAGARKLYHAVGSTMGPKGKNVIIDNGVTAPLITKDGVTVARSINLKDKLESIGANLIKEVAAKTNEAAGDGTTTATVLAYNLLQSGLKMKASGRLTSDLQKGIEWATKTVIDDLTRGAIQIAGDRESIINVGQISSRDRSVGELIADAVEKVGPNGLITIEPAKSTKTTLEVTDGLELSNGYVSPYFVTNQEKLTAELNNCLILVTTQKISTMKDILRVLEAIQTASKSLLIVADDIEGEALHALIVNKTNKIIKVCAIKAPAFGEHRHELLSDLALVTGATLIDSGFSKPLSSVGSAELGACNKVTVSKSNTIIVSDVRNEAVRARIATLESAIDHARKNPGSLSDDKFEQLKTRLAKLSGGVAVVKVGGSTEVELFEKKDRVEDALNATLAAVQEGIHAGGGTALCLNAFKLSKRLPELSKTRSDDFCSGVRVVIEACQAPLKTIVSNAGNSPDVVLAQLETNFNNDIAEMAGYGFNAGTGVFCNLIESGVIDPVKVTRLALEYASSVAQLLLTTECVVFDAGNE